MAANANLTGLSKRHGVKVWWREGGTGEQVGGDGDHRGGKFVQVTPLTQRAARITLSNMPLFVSDEFLAKKLSRHGKLVSPIRKVLSGCRSPLLRHVVSHHRQVHMVLNNNLLAISSALKCFNCGEEGHLARACPSRLVSGERENVKVVVEVTGESGEAGKVMDLPGVAIEVVCGFDELGKTGEGMGEMGEAGETWVNLLNGV
ncbi:hypothetical protein D4764_08G0001610 [Takifugu flavidus]|uniref:CCHC-type domain-containing protein n=1 Tax=Takifugu flavidus TaxID=433684 RepID=A0A5C6MLP7_9TELE|nr:hypothetical protein D4764_08G0001610 [Takifugu flavidus]